MKFAFAALGSKIATGKVELSDAVIHSCIICTLPASQAFAGLGSTKNMRRAASSQHQRAADTIRSHF